MFELLFQFKRITLKILAIMMAFVLLSTTIELGWLIIKDVMTPPLFLS